MNFLEGVFSSPPLHFSIQQQADWKKERLGITKTVEAHKVAMGFFLDRYEGSPEEKKILQNLTRLEWFGGSMTASALTENLSAFLETDEAAELHPVTQQQIAYVVQLLQATQDQSAHIDIIRSGSMALSLLATTGNPFWCAVGLDFSVDEESIQQLSDRALHQIIGLGEKEKALFLVGTLQHETMLSIAYRGEDVWEVCYYDTAQSKQCLVVYSITGREGNPFLEKSFWETLYRYKFSKYSSDQVRAHFAKLGERSNGQISSAMISDQKKNTCHFRCLFAILKDHIIRHSLLGLDVARSEWSQFQASFGQFMLDRGALKDQELITLATQAQKSRYERAQYRSIFVNDKEFDETVKAYQAMAACFGFDGQFLANQYASGELSRIAYLEGWADHLLRELEKCLIPLDQLKKRIGHINNRWVEKTFALFEERYQQSYRTFQRQLHDELDTISSDWNLQLEEIPIPCVGKVNFHKRTEYATRTAISEAELNDVLALLIKNPRSLTRFSQRRCLTSVLLQAIQQGKLEEVTHIYQQMSAKDR